MATLIMDEKKSGYSMAWLKTGRKTLVRHYFMHRDSILPGTTGTAGWSEPRFDSAAPNPRFPWYSESMEEVVLRTAVLTVVKDPPPAAKIEFDWDSDWKY